MAVFREQDRLVAHRVLLVLRAGPWHLVLEKGDTNRRGRWRRGDNLAGRVIGFTGADGSVGGDPAQPRLASDGLRRHLLNLWRRPEGDTPIIPEESP